MTDVLEQYKGYGDGLWGYMHDTFSREKGLNRLGRHDKAIEELNYHFKQHNLGYEFVNGEVIRIDNKMLHQEVIYKRRMRADEDNKRNG